MYQKAVSGAGGEIKGDQPARMERVIVHADGRAVSRQKTLAGGIFEVEKTSRRAGDCYWIS